MKLKTATLLSTMIVLAGWSAWAYASPLTFVAKGPITVRNFEVDDYNEEVGLAVDPAMIPFQNGDEMRYVVTYETSSPPRYDPHPRCSGGDTKHFPGAVSRAILSVGGITVLQVGAEIVVGDCGPNVGGDYVSWGSGGGAGSISGQSIDGLRPDAPFVHHQTDIGCLASAEQVPGGLLDPSTCPILPGSLLNQTWAAVLDGHAVAARYLFAQVLFDDLTFELVTSSAVIGSNVVVAPNFAGGGMLMTFDVVTEVGDVNVISFGPSDPEVPPPPSAFDFSGTIFEIVSTVRFTGDVEICLPWNDPNVSPTMLHYTGGAWEILPTSVSNPGIFCARTTSFSWFALVVPGAALRNMQVLLTAITNLNLKKGLANSLDVKLQSAKRALEDMRNNNDVAARGSMTALVNAVDAQRGKGLTQTEADGLILLADSVINQL